jgi:uncharacterized membrane protein YdbT with pleckstrin-like domain
MAYPDRLLTTGEVVEYDMRPHWRLLAVPAVVLVGLVFVGVYALTAMPPGWEPARWVVVLLLAALLVWLVVGPVVRWATTQYVLTNRRVIVRSGIVARQGRDMPLARVNDVHFAYTVVDRLLGCGTLVVESAAESGQLVIHAVPDVELVQREVFRLHEEDDLRRRRSGG